MCFIIAKARAIATVGGDTACEAEVTFSLYDNKKGG